MDIHKPKPWHGVREFLKEIGTIVIGVLIALGAEAVVQELAWARRVHDAETDMRRDLEDDARISFERLALANCDTEQIAAIRTALVKNRDDGTPVPLFPAYRFGTRILFYETWQNVRSLQLTGHIPTERLRDYGRAFHLVENMHDQSLAAAAHLPAIRTLSANAGAISSTERDRLFLALQTFETDASGLNVTALRFLEAAKRVGVETSAADKARILMSMSDPSRAGACVRDPSPTIERSARDTDWFRNARGGNP